MNVLDVIYIYNFVCVKFSCSVMSNSLWPHGMQYTKPPCPSPTPGVYSIHVHRVGDATQTIHPLWLITFRMGWLDLLAAQGTLKHLLQHYSSKASVLFLWCSAFFIVQLSHPYMTTGKTIALTRWTFVSKVMSLLFNMLSRLVIAFLPRIKGPLISWLQSPSAVILKPKEIKSVTVSIVSPSICYEVMGPDAMIFVF